MLLSSCKGNALNVVKQLNNVVPVRSVFTKVSITFTWDLFYLYGAWKKRMEREKGGVR